MKIYVFNNVEDKFDASHVDPRLSMLNTGAQQIKEEIQKCNGAILNNDL